jgi:hypothetical protein
MVSGRHAQRFVVGEELEEAELLTIPAELEGQKQKHYSWQRVPLEVRSVPSGRLVLELPDDSKFRGRRRRWADRKRWRLEDKLPEVLAELDWRRDLVAEHQAQTDRARATRHGRWAAAMAEARELFLEDYRRQALLEQVGDWTEALSILAYCDALNEMAQGETDPGRRVELVAWSTWARSHAEALDPLRRRPRMPPDPDPTPEDLRPFCGPWSPYGPEDGSRRWP